MISLTQQERDKFALWLEQEASNDDVIATQMATLIGYEIMIKRLKQRAAIFSIVATELRRIEDMSI